MDIIWLIAASAECLILTLRMETGSRWPEASSCFIAQQLQQQARPIFAFPPITTSQSKSSTLQSIQEANVKIGEVKATHPFDYYLKLMRDGSRG